MGLKITWYQFSNALYSFPLAQVERISMFSFVWQPPLCQGWVDSWHKVGKIYWLVSKIYLFKWWFQLVFTAPKGLEIVTQTETQTASSTYLFQWILESWLGMGSKEALPISPQIGSTGEWLDTAQKIGSSRKITEIGRSTKIGKIGFTGVLQSDFFTNSVKTVLLHI